jgi:pyruvate/2-oxoglutarate dehydrogenase complex dihydrolipoamide dehydrogenase (E3) component
MERCLAEQKGVTTLAHTRTISAVKDGILYKVTYARGNVEKSIKVEAILVASNRIPSVDLGLENASVAYTPAGIKVNENLQTSAKHIYAAGDVVGSGQSTHTALLQSRVAVHNILHKNKLTPDYTATPSVVFTFPQIASVGLTADDCLKRDLQVDVALAPLNIISRSNTSDFRDGFVKIIADKKGYVLGSTIVAPNAGDMIAELGLAVKYKIKASELATTPHAFLTWSEAIRVAASKIS